MHENQESNCWKSATFNLYLPTATGLKKAKKISNIDELVVYSQN